MLDFDDLEGPLFEIKTFLNLAILALENKISAFPVLFHTNELFENFVKEYQSALSEYMKKDINN